MNFEEKTKNQGTSQPEASHSENGDMAWACCEELVELDDVQLATVVGGVEEGGVVTPFALGGPKPVECPIGTRLVCTTSGEGIIKQRICVCVPVVNLPKV